jgi:hypothetical protein
MTEYLPQIDEGDDPAAGEMLVRAFQILHEHRETNRPRIISFNDKYQRHYADRDTISHGVAAEALIDTLNDVGSLLVRGINDAIDQHSEKRVTVQHLYENRPAIFANLACSTIATDCDVSSRLAGRHLVNAAGYLLPIVGYQKPRLIGKTPPPPIWWVRVLDTASGEPLIRLEFSE